MDGVETPTNPGDCCGQIAMVIRPAWQGYWVFRTHDFNPGLVRIGRREALPAAGAGSDTHRFKNVLKNPRWGSMRAVQRRNFRPFLLLMPQGSCPWSRNSATSTGRTTGAVLFKVRRRHFRSDALKVCPRSYLVRSQHSREVNCL
jgi:hypothetical protein